MQTPYMCARAHQVAIAGKSEKVLVLSTHTEKHRHTDRQTDRQTGRQTHRHTHTQTDTHVLMRTQLLAAVSINDSIMLIDHIIIPIDHIIIPIEDIVMPRPY